MPCSEQRQLLGGSHRKSGVGVCAALAALAALGALGDGNVEVWSRDGRRDETKAWHSYRTPSLACCP